MASIEAGQLHLRQGKNDIAFEIFLELAQYESDPDAQFCLLNMNYCGLLTAANIDKCLGWLERESARGNGYADYSLGLIYEQGLMGGAANYKEAVRFYEKAIKDDMHDACCNLGKIYVTGAGINQGVPKDGNKGIALLIKGAELGSREAAYALGSFLGKEEFAPLDQKGSALYLKLASLGGHDNATRALAIMQHTVKDQDFSNELEQASVMHSRIRDMRQSHKLL